VVKGWSSSWGFAKTRVVVPSEGEVKGVGASALLWGVVSEAVRWWKGQADIPRGRNGNADGLVTKKFLQIVDCPCACGLPIGSGASHDEGGVPGDESHEFECARLLVELLDDGAVELIVVCNELGNRGFIPGVPHLDIMRCL
jgi:hypothetical protein